MVRAPTNIAASIRQRLLNISRETGQDFNIVLVTYGLERLIYRLSVSAYRDRFVLKGGMLVSLWTTNDARFTRDVDFLGFSDPDADAQRIIFTEIPGINDADGLEFDVENLSASAIREDGIYGGVRFKTTAFLAKNEIPVTIDVGFGDAVEGHSTWVQSLTPRFGSFSLKLVVQFNHASKGGTSPRRTRKFGSL